MLTDRLDVPHTLLGRFKPQHVGGGQTQERAYNLNDNVYRDLYSTFVHKNNLFFSIISHLQPLEVNSRAFDDMIAWQRTFLADILHLSDITRNRFVIHTGYNILPGLLCTTFLRKQEYLSSVNCWHIHNSTSRPTLTRFEFTAFPAVTFFLLSSESSRFRECYSVLRQHYFNYYLLRNLYNFS